MGWYRDRLFPRLLDSACATAPKQAVRAAVCAPLAGDVLEIGFGTGLNLVHLPVAVRRLLVVDPMSTTRRRTAERIAASPVPVEVVGLDGRQLALADASVDAVLMTWTLCSIADPGVAVGEIARVLRPGGRLHFVEHGRAPDDRVRHWQDRLNGIQRRIACGCNLNRDIPAILDANGLRVDGLATFYVDGDPKLLGWTFQGTATRG